MKKIMTFMAVIFAALLPFAQGLLGAEGVIATSLFGIGNSFICFHFNYDIFYLSLQKLHQIFRFHHYQFFRLKKQECCYLFFSWRRWVSGCPGEDHQRKGFALRSSCDLRSIRRLSGPCLLQCSRDGTTGSGALSGHA